MNIHDLAKRMSEKTAEIYRLKERKKCDAETIASLKKALASREKELTLMAQLNNSLESKVAIIVRQNNLIDQLEQELNIVIKNYICQIRSHVEQKN